MAESKPGRFICLNFILSFIAILYGVESNIGCLLYSTHASAPFNAPANDSMGNIGSAALLFPKGEAIHITMGFAPIAKAALAVASTTLGSLLVSAVIIKVSPGFRLNNSSVIIFDAFPNSY